MKPLRICQLVASSLFLMSCFSSCSLLDAFTGDPSMVLPDREYQDPNWVLVENSP